MIRAASASSRISSGEKSNDIIRDGLLMLANLDHRGARGADPLVGDGAGCLIQIPDDLLRDWAQRTPSPCRQPGDYAVAMCFLPQDAQSREAATARLERFIEIEGQILLGWRDVPTDPAGLGEAVLESHAGDPPGDRCARPAHRRPGRVRAQDPDDPQADPESAVASSPRSATFPASRTSTFRPSPAGPIVYKGLLLATQVGTFYTTSPTR